MAFERSARPLAKCMQCASPRIALPIRTFTTTPRSGLETETQTSETTQAPPPSAPKKRNPNAVYTRHGENQLLRNQRLMPVGSRRRRAALQHSAGIPFAELPYQCFQEARTYLREDRAEKLESIRVQRERIERLQESNVSPQDNARKEQRLASMRKHLEELKILADINDPMVKKKFEDGQGDMNKPIYRHLADLKWRSYKRRVLVQRITQMNVIPDVLPVLDPIVNTSLSFAGRKIPHGDFVDSRISEKAPQLNIQCYDKGKRLVTIAVVNPDVPDVSKDGFNYRCHFLACNIEISHTDTQVNLAKLVEDKQVVLPWLPAYAQKGLPYQRMSIFIFNQSEPDATAQKTIDVAAIKKEGRYTEREGFNLRSFSDKQVLNPVGVDLFRTKFDEGTAEVMQRADIPGWDVEFKRMRVEPLPYQRKDGERYR